MVEAVQARMKGRTLREMKPVLLVCDSGAMKARRLIADLASREAAVVAP